MLNNYENATDADIKGWIDQFHRDGYLFLPKFLTRDFCRELREDLDKDFARDENDKDAGFRLRTCLFERSAANLRLFDMDPMAKFAETMLDWIGHAISPPVSQTHVIHNNSFIVRPGCPGLSTWHQDDPPHYVVTGGEPPKNVHLPVLWFTANYYLTDVTEVAHGATEVVPASHLFGKEAPQKLEGTEWQSRVKPCLGEAGSVVMFNNQVWHRGGPNTSDRTRYITQVTYGRRMVNSMYYPFMNYQMPEHVYKDANPRLKRLLGFLPHGPYG